MNKKMKIIISSLMIIIFFSIGSVSAEEIVGDNSTDILEISSEVAIVEDNTIIDDGVSQEIDYSNDSDNEKSQISISENKVYFDKTVGENVLGSSLDEGNVLQSGNIITFEGNHFADLRSAINNAQDGDIIDLEGKTIIAVPIGGNSRVRAGHLTLKNGVIDAGNVVPITLDMRSEFYNCVLENITFKNYREDYAYGMIIQNCNLTHVKFENFSFNVAGFVIRGCNLNDVNFTECHSLIEEDENDYEYGAMVVAYHSTLDNCNFVNCTTNRHSGAICIGGEYGNRVDVFNSNFINCRAGIGGAIYVHGNDAITEDYHSNIINCTFINNTATERGGAIGSSQNYLVVENCLFENNTAKQGAAYMLAGIDHGLDGIPEGHYNTILNCTFRNNTGTEEGGAVHITGNNNKAINCTFWDNYATEGNGSAIYVHGENSSVINTGFYNHECSRGTVYIIGNNTIIENSTFENNTASNGGAGVYVQGDNTLINNSVFKNNSAVYHGGAVHSQGDNLTITNSNFTSNTAIASTDDLNQGLGGAVYIQGNNSNISYSNFENNIARNGSAIYNRGQNLTIEDDTFIENQAWSYLITGITNDKRFYYDPEANVTIEVTHKGGDNIINAIYNDGSPNNIFFKNVTYELSVNNRTNSGPNIVNPKPSVEESEGGTLVYQDSREDNQNITVIVTHLETGKVVINITGKTGILGNLTVSEKGLLPGNYSVNVTHAEDGLYKFITNMTYFEILPLADLAIEKMVSNKTPNLGDEIVWILKVTNKGTSNVTDAYAVDKLPNGLIFNGADGNYDETTGIWYIGELNVGDTKVLQIRTIVNITNTTILNVATVNSSVYDPNETNNIANNTTKSNTLSDLSVIKLVSQKVSVVGDTITWTIKVTNNGPDIAVDAYAIDVLPSGISYVSDDSNGKYDLATGRWDIGDLAKGATATLNILTKIIEDNTTIVNNVFANSSTPDSNMSNNNASNDTKVLESNFIVNKITITPLVALGEQVKFQIVVRNTGLTTLNNVFIEEFSYDGLEFAYAQNQSRWNHAIVNGKNRWTLKDQLDIDGVTVLTVVFNTNKTGTFTNVVVAGSDETENKTAKNDTTVVKPEISVEKVTITPLVSLGDQVIFEIIVKNTGLVNVTNVFVDEFDYEGLIFDHANTEFLWIESTVNNKTRWTYDFPVAPGVTHGFTVVFNTTEVGNFTNVVVAGGDNADNKTANNTTKVVKPELSVEKITITPQAILGDQVIFELIVRNTGLVNLTNVFIEEFEHEGLIFDHANTLGFWNESEVDGKLRWTYGFSFAPGVTHGFTVYFNTTKTGNFTNVIVAGSENADNKTTNNTTKVVKPEFTVEKISLNSLVAIGDQVTFEIVVTNTGVVDLTNVVVKEEIPDELVFDHAYGLGTHWKYRGNYSWVYDGVFATQQTHGFFVVFNATKVGNFTNVVVVTSNKTTENKTAKNNTTVVAPDFTVEKISLDPIVPLNNLTRFQIIVKNVGKVDLTGLFIEETDYQNLTYKTFVDNGLWSYNFNDTNPGWKFVSSLKPNQVATLTVVFNATEVGNWTNTVTAGADKVENKTANNTTEVYVKPPVDPEENATNPNLSVEKIALKKLVTVGDRVTFEIVVRNIGDKRLHNVTIHETSYDGLKFINFYDIEETWIYNGDMTFTYNATLYKGETTSFYIIFETNKTGELVNVITATSNETENKTTNDTVEVVEPKLEVGKLAINDVVTLGNQVTFEILVRNPGKVSLTNVVVEEKSFEGLTYAGWYDDTGLWTKNRDLTWSLKTSLEPNEYVGFFVVFNTTKAGNFTNVIVVNSNEVPNKTANDTVTVLKPDYTIEKVTVNKVVTLGEGAYFDIIIRNTGETTLRNFTVHETFFDDGLVYNNWYDDTGLWSKTGNHSWTFNSYLSPGVVTGFFVTFNTTKVGHFTNVVTLTGDDIPNKTSNDTVDVVKPDYTIEKLTVNRIIPLGDIAYFEIIIRNTGDVTLRNFTVHENFDDGLVFDRIYDDTGYWNQTGKHSWTFTSFLSPGVVTGFFVAFNTTKVGHFNNFVTLTSDVIPNKTSNDSIDVVKPEFDVKKITVNNTVVAGEQVIFEIVVNNYGNIELNDLTVYEKEFEGLSYAGWYDNTYKWIKNDGLSWTYNSTLEAKKTANFFVIFNTTKIGNFTNVVVANSSGSENKSANNTTNVVGADLSVVKLVSNKNPKYGEEIVWTIIVTNNGPATAKDVYVEDKLPNGLIFKESDGNYNATSGIWTIGDLINTQTAILNIITLVNISNVTVINVAVVNSTTPDSNESNNIANNTTNAHNPQMNVTKTTLTPVAYLGEQVVFEIVVRNTGDCDLDDVFVRESVIDGLVYDSFDGDGWNYADNIFTYGGVLAAGDVSSFTVAFNTTRSGNFTNVIVSGSNKTENKTTNNTTTVYSPNLTVEKITVTPIAHLGEQVVFEIIVRNTGDCALDDVFVEEKSFDGLVYDSFNGVNWNKEGNIFKYNGVLAIGGENRFTVTFNTTRSGNFTNVVVAGSDKTENKTANNTTTVVEGKLDVEKITLTPIVLVGDQVIFEIVVRNVGEAILTNVFVEESSYDGLIYDSYLDNVLWTHSVVDGKHRWTLNSDLAVNEIVGFFVVFNTTGKGNFTNVVVAGSDETENKTTNNTTKVSEPKLDVQKIALTPIVSVGNQTSFEIVVRNTGEVVLHNVVVEETSYEGLTYDSYVENKDWTYSVINGKNVWTLNKVLNVHEAVTLIVNFNTTEVGNFTNIVTVGSTESENKTANNTTVVNPVADLSVVKLVSDSNPNFGDVITWTIIVTNSGPSDSENVIVVDNLPSGLVYQSSEASIGSYDAATGVWTIGNLAYNKTATLSIKTLVNISNQEILNVAVVNSSTYDPNSDNNNANNTTNVSPSADLSIEKVVIAIDGEYVTWSIKVTNLGPDTAINTRASDVLSNALILVAYDLTTGSFDPNTGVWTIGDMQNGDVAILIIQTLVNATGTIVNEARVVSDTYDPNMTNNNDSDYIVVEDVPDVEPPVPAPKAVDVTPATGNPLIMVLLALFTLAVGTLRRKK